MLQQIEGSSSVVPIMIRFPKTYLQCCEFITKLTKKSKCVSENCYVRKMTRFMNYEHSHRQRGSLKKQSKCVTGEHFLKSPN